ncbi:DUF58 domain-containing protein [Micromonospora vulcania]
MLSRLQLLVTRKLDGLLQGDYAGLLPGPGSEAGESREYRPGDDVRRMDWPVTARTTTPHVRRTVADRELETWLALDLSASLDFGTGQWLKREVVVAAAAAITHLTVRGGNRIGAVIGTGGGAVAPARRWRGGPPPVGPGVLTRLPARSGRKEAQGLLRTVARTAIQPGRGDLGALIEMLNRPPRRRGVAVVVSTSSRRPSSGPGRCASCGSGTTCWRSRWSTRGAGAARRGVLPVVDPESGELHEVQTADPRLRQRYAEAATAQRATIAAALRGAGAAHLRLRTDRDWLLDMVRFVAAQRHARTRGRHDDPFSATVVAAGRVAGVRPRRVLRLAAAAPPGVRDAVHQR